MAHQGQWLEHGRIPLDDRLLIFEAHRDILDPIHSLERALYTLGAPDAMGDRWEIERKRPRREQ